MRCRASWWWLLAAGLPFGCGSADRVTDPGTAVEQEGPPVVDAAVSAEYRWSDCGRIEASGRPVGARYTTDGSILILEATGRLRLFPQGSTLATTLVPEHAPELTRTEGIGLSPDGVWLLLPGAADVPLLYATRDRSPIAAGSGALEPVTGVDAAAESCAGTTLFSTSSELVATHDADSVCIWESMTGPLLGSFALPAAAGRLTGAYVLGSDRFLLVQGDRLIALGFQGEQLASIDLSAIPGMYERNWGTQFSPDGRYLLLNFVTELGDGNPMPRIVALDTESGSVLWEHTPASPPYFRISPDSAVALVAGGDILRLEDGEPVGHDAPQSFPQTVDIGPGARRQLRLSEQVGEWDTERQELLQLYGSHVERILDLDITPDGRHFASHGDWAVVWQLEPEFARSVPLFHGAAADESWNVALAPSGNVMSVSGDNIAFFKRGGAYQHAGAPAAAVPLNCASSADWSFSPRADLVAGTHYGAAIELYDTGSLTLSQSLAAENCYGGVAFSPDGSLLVTASLELFETASWTKRWGQPPGTSSPTAERDVVFSPDGSELVVTRCPNFNSDCRATRYHTVDGSLLAEVPALSGEQVRYSPEGHWLVSKNRLLHLPTGATLDLPAAGEVAIFTPDGDIIAGELDGSLARYCRTLP